MSDEGTNARRFLDAFADIEDAIKKRHDHTKDQSSERPKFWALVDTSDDELIKKHKETLKRFGNLRNAISHSSYLNDNPIADPRIDTVEEIERLRELVIRPPRLRDALKDHGKPQVFSPDDGIKEFLRIVTELDFSQAPVAMGNGKYKLITTNAVARWFGHNPITHGGAVEDTPIDEILKHSESGDRLEILPRDTTVAKAINIFAGQDSPTKEPPAALLVMDVPGQPPLLLSTRADLAVLYQQLGE